MAKTANPVKLKTIGRRMELPDGTVEAWADVAGFPAAAAGVALEADVRVWAVESCRWTESGGLVLAPEAAPAPEAASVAELPPLADREALADTVASVFGPAPDDVVDTAAAAEPEDVVWVTVRIPVDVSDGRGPRVAHAPMTGFRFGKADHERRGREVMGRVFEGCRKSHVTRADGTHVDRLAHSLKWIFEEIAGKLETP